MREQAMLVCALADMPQVVPGSIFDHCCEICGRRVMTAPSGQRILKERPGIMIICGPCFDPMSVDTVEPAGTMKEVVQEAQNARPNLRRGRN
jgi:hypothetical protein